MRGGRLTLHHPKSMRNGSRCRRASSTATATTPEKPWSMDATKPQCPPSPIWAIIIGVCYWHPRHAELQQRSSSIVFATSAQQSAHYFETVLFGLLSSVCFQFYEYPECIFSIRLTISTWPLRGFLRQSSPI